MNRVLKSLLGVFLAVMIPVFLSTACGKMGKKKGVPGPNDTVYSVTTADPIEREVPDVIEVSGTFIPIQTLEVKSDFSGKVQALSVVEGQTLLSGDALLKIEDEKLPWVLDQQRAQLREAEAEMDLEAQSNGGYPEEEAYEEEEEEPEEGFEEEPFGYREPERPQDPYQQEREFAEDGDEALYGGEGIDPTERLQQLRQRAMRARRLAAQRRTARQRRQTEPRVNERDEEVFESRQTLNQAKIDRIRADVSLTEKQLQGSTLSSPIDGFVKRVEVTEGSLVKPEDVLLEIITVDPIDLSVNLPKGEVGRINKSTSATVTAPDLPNTTLNGEISFIGAELDAEQKSVEIRVRVDNREQKIKVGMEGSATLAISKETHQALLVPSYAVVREAGKRYIYVADGQVATRREVTTGSTFDGWIEIKKGLRKKDSVVTQGVSQLEGEEEFIKPAT